MKEWVKQGINEGRNEGQKHWMQEGMNEERNEWVNVWTSEWMNEWLDEWIMIDDDHDDDNYYYHDNVFSKLCISHTTSLEELCLSSLAISCDTFVLSEHDKNILVSMWFMVAIYDKCQGLTLWLVQNFWKNNSKQSSSWITYHVMQETSHPRYSWIHIGVSLQRLQHHPKFRSTCQPHVLLLQQITGLVRAA